MPAPPPAAVCIVLHWNNAPDTLACLAALALQTVPLTVVVVDNGSTDDSAAIIRHYVQTGPPNVHLLQTGENRGFSAGNNAGIRWAAHLQPRFLWLLNNDTVPPPDTLAQLLAEAEAHPRAGLVGSVLYYAHAPARVQAWGGGHIRPSTAYSTHFTAPHIFGPNDYVTFASVLLRASMLAETGLLDERFFMYFEDAELSLRAHKAGWHTTVAAHTAVLHREGASDTPHSTAKDATVTASGLRLIALHGTSPRLGSIAFVTRRILRRMVAGRFRLALGVAQVALRSRFGSSQTR